MFLHALVIRIDQTGKRNHCFNNNPQCRISDMELRRRHIL